MVCVVFSQPNMPFKPGRSFGAGFHQVPIAITTGREPPDDGGAASAMDESTSATTVVVSAWL
jgi:hypothetical protein